MYTRYEDIFNELESQHQRFHHLGNFERELLEFYEYGWNVSKEGMIVLPMNYMNLNPDLGSLHGGILIVESTIKNGLCIYGQSQQPARLAQANSLQTSLLHFITQNYDNQKIPVLQREETSTPIHKERKYMNFTSYKSLLEYLALQVS
jgi:hypothetical protein